MVLLHIPRAELAAALTDLDELCRSGGVIGIGFKSAASDEETVAPPKPPINAARFTAFYRVETVRKELLQTEWKDISVHEAPSNEPKYGYAWVIVRKPH